MPAPEDVPDDAPGAAILKKAKDNFLARVLPMQRGDLENLKQSLKKFPNYKPGTTTVVIISNNFNFWNSLLHKFEVIGTSTGQASQLQIQYLKAEDIVNRTLCQNEIIDFHDFIVILCGNHLTVSTAEYVILL